MISRDLAERFIERVSKHTDYNVNIMDEDGIIIASRETARIGQYHEIAYRIVHGTEDILDTTGMNIPGVLPGINMVIITGGRREGCVGVTGDPEEIRPVAMMVKMALETMLGYERRQEQLRLRTNRKEHFVYLLTHAGSDTLENIRALAAELGYQDHIPRIPILLAADGDTGALLTYLRSQPLHHARLDFSARLDERHVVIFKALPSRGDNLLREYKAAMADYLTPLLHPAPGNEDRAGAAVKGAYIGSIQADFENYSFAFRHTRWLEEQFPECGTAVYFYDHSGTYLLSRVPGQELKNVFRCYTEGVSAEKLRQYYQTGNTLLGSNFRFQEAADRLFIHKNTMVYRYQALKAFLEIDPIASAEGRAFLEMFCEYLKKTVV